jgi:hypothetical protein
LHDGGVVQLATTRAVARTTGPEQSFVCSSVSAYIGNGVLPGCTENPFAAPPALAHTLFTNVPCTELPEQSPLLNTSYVVFPLLSAGPFSRNDDSPSADGMQCPGGTFPNVCTILVQPVFPCCVTSNAVCSTTMVFAPSALHQFNPTVIGGPA